MTKQVTREMEEEAARLYREGASARAVAKAMDVSHQTVLNLCRRAGVEIRPPYRNHPE
jgi:transposase-like protein